MSSGKESLTLRSNSCRLNWHPEALLGFLRQSLALLRERQGYADERSSWWIFWHTALRELPSKVIAFVAGRYVFSPMLKYRTPEETVLVWRYMDKLFVRVLLLIIKPVFPYIISPQVFHLQGPTGVKKAIDYVKKGITQQRYRYCFRIDIKSYYASMNHSTLINQLSNVFKDERLSHYFRSIITAAHMEDGVVTIPTQGIARRSSLSPVFGAVYLSPLDEAFAERKGILYARYMDDVILLTETKRQYIKAKQKLRMILKSLKLSYSPKKTKMGLIRGSFHFLGVVFSLIEEEGTETQIQFPKIQVRLHKRTCARSLSKVELMDASADLPRKVQSYLRRWGTWWSQTTTLYYRECLESWVEYTTQRAPAQTWLGRGLLLLR